MDEKAQYEEIRGIKARVVRRFFDRARGLIGAKPLPAGEGLLLVPCKAIHTCFMGFAIDAIFLDAQNRVVREVKNVKPWRLFVWGGWRAVKVLEISHSPA